MKPNPIPIEIEKISGMLSAVTTASAAVRPVHPPARIPAKPSMSAVCRGGPQHRDTRRSQIGAVVGELEVCVEHLAPYRVGDHTELTELQWRAPNKARPGASPVAYAPGDGAGRFAQ